jgi:ArsR family transcriptional regulator, arsenate/arsenite/antimonite-responsive transcriptional repressor
MGATKTGNFTENQNDLAMFAKALGHPARVAIIEYLVNSDKCITGEIVDVIPLAQATVSQHLKELKNAGLIKGSVEGNAVCYCIDCEKWDEFKKMLNTIFEKLDKPVCC